MYTIRWVELPRCAHQRTIYLVYSSVVCISAHPKPVIHSLPHRHPSVVCTTHPQNFCNKILYLLFILPFTKQLVEFALIAFTAKTHHIMSSTQTRYVQFQMNGSEVPILQTIIMCDYICSQFSLIYYRGEPVFEEGHCFSLVDRISAINMSKLLYISTKDATQVPEC